MTSGTEKAAPPNAKDDANAVHNSHLNQAERSRIPISGEIFRRYRRVSKWKSPLLIGVVFTAAVCLMFFGGSATGWVLAPVSFLLISALQSHLTILLHEGAHYLLHPNRRVNDLLADICGMPILMTVRNYRTYHLAHHEHSGDPDKDPERRIYAAMGYDYKPYQRRRDLISMLLKDLFLVNLFRFSTGLSTFMKSHHNRPVLTLRDGVRFIGFVALPIGAAASIGLLLEVLVLWFLPLLTLTFLLIKLHGMGEHSGAVGPTEFQRTWHHQPNPIVDFFIYPIRSGFHLTHHTYPGIPWYNMKAFHTELMKIKEWRDGQSLLDSDGYFFGSNAIFTKMIYSNDSDQVRKIHDRPTKINTRAPGTNLLGPEHNAPFSAARFSRAPSSRHS
jgi:fatty acid desaturase